MVGFPTFSDLPRSSPHLNFGEFRVHHGIRPAPSGGLARAAAPRWVRRAWPAAAGRYLARARTAGGPPRASAYLEGGRRQKRWLVKKTHTYKYIYILYIYIVRVRQSHLFVGMVSLKT